MKTYYYIQSCSDGMSKPKIIQAENDNQAIQKLVNLFISDSNSEDDFTTLLDVKQWAYEDNTCFMLFDQQGNIIASEIFTPEDNYIRLINLVTYYMALPEEQAKKLLDNAISVIKSHSDKHYADYVLAARDLCLPEEYAVSLLISVVEGGTKQ